MQAEPTQSHVVQSSPGCELGATILGAVDVVEDGGELAIFGPAVVNREVVGRPRNAHRDADGCPRFQTRRGPAPLRSSSSSARLKSGDFQLRLLFLHVICAAERSSLSAVKEERSTGRRYRPVA